MYFTRTDKFIRWARKVIRPAVFGVILLFFALCVMVFACRYNLPLPGWCYAVNNAVTPQYLKLRREARPLAPAIATGKKYSVKTLNTINAVYRRACGAIHNKWVSLMREVDPANEYGLVDYDAAVKDFVREIPADMKPPAKNTEIKPPADIPAGESE